MELMEEMALTALMEKMASTEETAPMGEMELMEEMALTALMEKMASTEETAPMGEMEFTAEMVSEDHQVNRGRLGSEFSAPPTPGDHLKDPGATGESSLN